MQQNFENHTQRVPLFLFAILLFLAVIVGSLVNLYQSWGDHQRLYSASLIVALTLAAAITGVHGRLFALKAQDRAIRAEENLRHFALTGKLLDPRLEPLQIVALRFASDGEFPALAAKAANEGMKPVDIKKAVKNWRADFHRV